MKLKCLICEDIIESKSIHDFVTCKCGNCNVDGGSDYFRFGGKDFSKMVIINKDGTEQLVSDIENKRFKRKEDCL